MKRRKLDFKNRIHKQPKSKKNFFANINIFKYLSLLLILIFLIYIPYVIKKLIIINNIECRSQFGDCTTELSDRVRSAVGRDYYISKKFIDEVLKNDVVTDSYLIQYKIPSTIKIDVSVKKAKFGLKNGDNYFLVDINGLVLNVVNSTNLPVLNINTIPKVGDYLNDSFKFSLKIYEKMTFLYNVLSAEVLENELRVKTSENKIVHFPLEGDSDLLIGSLRLIFSRLNDGSQGIRMEDVSEIDLRFQNPILR